MVKVTTSLTIEKEILDHSKKNTHIDSLSQWVNDRYKEEFMSKEIYLKRISDLENELAQARVDLQYTIENENKLPVPALQWKWIVEVGQHRARRTTAKGVHSFFVHKFKNHVSFSTFRKLLQKAEEEYPNEQD